MPYNPSSFSDIARIAPQQHPDWMEQFKKGFNIGQLPQQAKARMLQNQLAQAQAEQAPQQAKALELQNALRQGQIDQLPAQLKSLQEKQAIERERQDLAAKKFAYESDPEAQKMKIAQSIQEAADKKTAALEAQQAFDAKQALPHLEDIYERLEEGIKIGENHPEWFGPGFMGFDSIGGQKFREQLSKTDNEDYGKLSSLFADIVGPASQALSGPGKVLASGLDYAIATKPGFDKQHKIATGMMKEILKKMGKDISTSKKHAGIKEKPIQMPVFETDKDFEEYWRGLSSSDKQRLKAQMQGGQ
jgi:hypothetical protein